MPQLEEVLPTLEKELWQSYHPSMITGKFVLPTLEKELWQSQNEIKNAIK